MKCSAGLHHLFGAALGAGAASKAVRWLGELARGQELVRGGRRADAPQAQVTGAVAADGSL